jgi:hypothetical protein
MADELDQKTREKGTGATLQLFGSMSSRYLNAIFTRAISLDLMVRHSAEAPGIYSHGPVVVDRETVHPIPLLPFGEYDLDHIDFAGPSCTSEAARRIIRVFKPDNPHVCIIGRGHSVKGLAEGLLEDDATVTVCHSKTRDLIRAAAFADVVVNSAPLPEAVCYNLCFNRGDLLLDISGGLARWRDSNLLTYIGPEDIGRLNISILLNRFVNV